MSEIEGVNVLDVKLKKNDAKAKTVRDYLKALLTTLWEEGEGFSGKRPFGNGGWEYDLVEPLTKAGYSEEEATQLIFNSIDAL